MSRQRSLGILLEWPCRCNNTSLPSRNRKHGSSISNQRSKKARRHCRCMPRKKLEAARADARAALSHLKTEFDAAVPFIIEGAKKRALWDQAEMRAAALKGKIVKWEVGDGSDGPELARLTEMMERERSTFTHDARIQALLQQESAKSAVVTNLINTNTSRSFGDAFDKPEDEAFRLKVRVTELELAATVASARERGYREGAQQHAKMYSTMAATWSGLQHVLETQIEKLSTADAGADGMLGDAVEKLRQLCTSAQTSYDDIFASDLTSSTSSLPSLPTVKTVPLPAQPRPSRFGLPARRRLSNAPITPLRSTLRPTRRSLALASTIGVPRRLKCCCRSTWLSSQATTVQAIQSRSNERPNSEKSFQVER